MECRIYTLSNLVWLSLHSFCFGDDEAKNTTDCWDICWPYNGTINVSGSGRNCQKWSHQLPHRHSFNNASFFPDWSVDAAENFCRDPVGIFKPGCYTMDPNRPWEYCNITLCNSTKTTSDLQCTHNMCNIDRSECEFYDPCFDPNSKECKGRNGVSDKTLIIAMAIIIVVVVIFTASAACWIVAVCMAKSPRTAASTEGGETGDPDKDVTDDSDSQKGDPTDSPSRGYSKDEDRRQNGGMDNKTQKEMQMIGTYLNELF